MNKRIVILFIISIIPNFFFGQIIKKDDASIAMFYLLRSELDSAKKYTDLSIHDATLNNQAKTWFYRARIYKEIFKLKEKDNFTSPSRLIAVEAYKKVLSLPRKSEFDESTKKSLKYLSSTFYNQIQSIIDMQLFEESIDSYNLYENTMLLAYPNMDLKERDIDFKLTLNSNIMSLFDAECLDSTINLDSNRVRELKSLQINLLSEVIKIDSNHSSANYMLAIFYYNQGVNIINNVDYSLDLKSLDELQNKFTGLLTQSLPYMQKAYDQNPDKREALDGLIGIHLGLNNLEKHQKLLKKLENLDVENR